MIGTRVGDLTLVRVLGSGGMGTVYLGEHALLDVYQAVKLLDPELTQSAQIVTRFLNEGRIAVKLRHRNLVTVHNIGRLPNDGPYFMVMEYLDGESLARFLAGRRQPLGMHETFTIVVQVLNCMQLIHGHGVVHRDIKPDNIFLVLRFGDPHFPIVLDFGVAQVSEQIAAGPGTRAGTVIGTPCYMAPEQLRGERVTGAADIFSIAIVTYEMSTGWLPYQRDDESRDDYFRLPQGEIYHRLRSGPPTDPRHWNPGLSDAWARAILAGLELEPARRPAGDRAFANLLADAVVADGVHEDGHVIMKQRAGELQAGDDLLETHRSRPPAPEPPRVPSGEIRYKLGAKLGAGGMAEVYLAELQGAEGFSRPVALKRVLAGLSEIAAFTAMFVTEARIASRLSHPNLVSVFDFHRDAEGRLCIVMEYVHGRDLATLIEAGPLSRALIIHVVGEVLRGLAYAHDVPDPNGGGRGLVHRDVSPQNVLLSYQGEVKLSDFGLAKANTTSGTAYSGSVRGKPSYMSPEQCNAEPLDARTDLYACGVMLHEMLAQRPLFVGTPREIVAQVLFKDIDPPSRVRSDVPADVEAIAMKLMARDRSARYASAEAAIADLVRCQDAPRDGRGELARVLAERFPEGADGKTVRPRDAGRFAAVPQSTLASAASQSIRSVPGRPRGRRRAIAIAAGAIAGATVMLVVLAVGQRQEVARIDVPAPTDAPEVVPTSAPDDPSPPSPAVVVPVPPPPPVATPVVAAADSRSSGAKQPRRVSASSSGDTARATAAKRTGTLVITVRPWALIEVNGKEAGETPYREVLTAGRYRVRLTNQHLGKDETVTVTVPPDDEVTIQKAW